MNILHTITFYIILILIFINGMTDAPNAIATLVGTRTMKFRHATIMSAIFDIIGLVTMIYINTSVADCISSLVDLGDSDKAMIALFSGMVSIIIFSSIAIRFGIPTSESHGLIAGLTGSAIAIGGFSSINFQEWKNVLIGLIWSIAMTFIFSIFIYKLLANALKNIGNRKIKIAQIVSACGISFVHGAQDGLKFIGVLIIYNSIVKNVPIPLYINPIENISIIIICAIMLGLGVTISTKKIVKKVGNEVVDLKNSEALCGDITTIGVLLFASLNRLPISTSHVKTMSIIGVGKASGGEINFKSIKEIFKTWIYTFPVCGGIAYGLTMLLK